jgi:hypothetical protein
LDLLFLIAVLQAEASKLLAELEQLRSISGDHAAMSAENARLKGEFLGMKSVQSGGCWYRLDGATALMVSFASMTDALVVDSVIANGIIRFNGRCTWCWLLAGLALHRMFIWYSLVAASAAGGVSFCE